MTVAELELTVNELIEQLEITLRRVPNAQRIRHMEKDVEGLNLDRFDSTHPEYHLRRHDDEILLVQYEASLTDPRRI